MGAKQGPSGQDGFSLLELLITALILGIASVGLALLLSRTQVATVAQGDTRVALYLAEQKIERLRGLGYSAAAVASKDNSGCGVAAQNNEPCYNETGLTAGAGQQTVGTTQVDTQTFTRLTCVRWVQDDNPELPADPLEPPDSWTCPSCPLPTFDPDTGACTANCTCTHNTKRIKVAVIPMLLGETDNSRTIDPNRVTVEALLTPIPKP